MQTYSARLCHYLFTLKMQNSLQQLRGKTSVTVIPQKRTFHKLQFDIGLRKMNCACYLQKVSAIQRPIRPAISYELWLKRTCEIHGFMGCCRDIMAALQHIGVQSSTTIEHQENSTVYTQFSLTIMNGVLSKMDFTYKLQ